MVDRDDIRPRGSVEVECSECEWSFWVDSLDPQLPDGPFLCPTCKFGPTAILPKADS